MVGASEPKDARFDGVATLEVSSLTPENFWAAHIAARKPALIRGHPMDMAWRASSLWTDEYLSRRAGCAQVLVEVRAGPSEGYGRGVRRRMAFSHFLHQMAAGDTLLYLTAQQVAVAPDGHPQLLAEPLLSLAGAGGGCSSGGISGGRCGTRSARGYGGDNGSAAADGGGSGGGAASAATGTGASSSATAAAATSGLYAAATAASTAAASGSAGAAADFPAAPELAGHLVPQSLNMWMGAATEGSSSGLHHDFHDNLYVLMRGTKRFRLYPPSAATKMYTYGKLKKLYDNGRIVYEGQGDVLADGTDAADVAKWRRRTEAEAAVAEAEAAVARGEKGARARQQRCEAALEAALEADLGDALEADPDDGDVDDDFDDFDDDRKEDGDEGEGEGPGWERRLGKAESGKGKAANKKKNQGGSGDSDGGGGEGLIVDPDTPPSFSRVPLGDTRVNDAQLAATFPTFPGRAAALEVTVRAGEMLYLPAGWFHEVTSYGSAGGPDSGHLAFNYWFHPPDNLDPSRRGFRAPYKSDFWPSLWRARVVEGLPGDMEPGLGAQPAAAAAAAGGDGRGDDVMAEAAEAARLQKGGGSGAGGKRRRLAAAEGAVGDAAAAATVEDGEGAPPRQRARRQPLSEGSKKGEADGEAEVERGEGGEADLDPPRRRPAAAARALMEKWAAAGRGAGAAELTEEEYQLLLLMETARRRQAAVQAMRAFFDKQMKLRRLRALRAALPPGRRHHPVVAVPPEVRGWRPRQQGRGMKEGSKKGQRKQHSSPAPARQQPR